MRYHFRLHDKDGGLTIRSAAAKNSNFMALCFMEPELLPSEVLRCGNKDFLIFLLLWPWLRPDDHIQTWPIFPWDIPDVW